MRNEVDGEMRIGKRVTIAVSPECRTHYEAYGNQIEQVQGRLAEIVSPDYVTPSKPFDPAHNIPVLWVERPIPALPWAGGWFAAEELNPIDETM